LSWCGRSGPAAAGSKSSSTVPTMLVVEAPDLAQKLGRPAAEEDCRRECWGSSTMSTLPEVDAPWATQMSDQSATEEDCMGEHWPASPMGEDVRRQPPPPPHGTRPHLIQGLW
jgi:hypothetical protein